MKAFEVNFDGLVGPTHNFAGLAFGNLASTKHAHQTSSPKKAALQGLEKMRRLMSLGIPQAILPPQLRPNIDLLKNLGFQGKKEEILQTAYKTSPALFAACYSASSMWVANAATVSPGRDSQDKRLHITPANLMSHLHRAEEAEMNYQLLRKIFQEESTFVVHPPLLSALQLGDEGAANHTRFCEHYNTAGYQMFVYGQSGLSREVLPTKFPARQTLEASQAIARLHQVDPSKTIFVKQNPKAIDQGVFHNDVISVGNQNVFFYHALAFEDTSAVLEQLTKMLPFELHFLEVKESELTLHDAVQSYLFNSQLVTLPDESMLLLAPEECRSNPAAEAVLNRLLEEKNPINYVEYVDCRESMRNGGGPACLRLRIVLTEEERQKCLSSVFLNSEILSRLVSWVEKHYRDTLTLEDLRDPQLIKESEEALDVLTGILGLGSLYSFQRES